MSENNKQTVKQAKGRSKGSTRMRNKGHVANSDGSLFPSSRLRFTRKDRLDADLDDMLNAAHVKR